MAAGRAAAASQAPSPPSPIFPKGLSLGAVSPATSPPSPPCSASLFPFFFSCQSFFVMAPDHTDCSFFFFFYGFLSTLHYSACPGRCLLYLLRTVNLRQGSSIFHSETVQCFLELVSEVIKSLAEINGVLYKLVQHPCFTGSPPRLS